MRFQARLFGSGQPATGALVQAVIDAAQLSIEPPGGRQRRLPLTQLRLRTAGFNERQWELSWDEHGEPQALLIEDPATLARLRAAPPQALAAAVAALTRSERRGRGWRGLAWSALALWLLLPVLALVALLAAAGPLSGRLAGYVPIEHEQKLGDWAFAALARRHQFLRDTEANRAVEVIGARLTRGSRYRYRWHVVRDPSLNAFAVPGGIVVVHTGLIQAAADAGELAGVLAHEIEHVEQRHSLRAMLQQAGLRLTLAAVTGEVGIAGEATGRLAALRFSRDHERAADAAGLARLNAAGLGGEGMLRLFDKLGAQGGAAAPPAWLSTHPATAERLARLRELVRQQRVAVGEPLELDWARVRASLPPP